MTAAVRRTSATSVQLPDMSPPARFVSCCLRGPRLDAHPNDWESRLYSATTILGRAVVGADAVSDRPPRVALRTVVLAEEPSGVCDRSRRGGPWRSGDADRVP